MGPPQFHRDHQDTFVRSPLGGDLSLTKAMGSSKHVSRILEQAALVASTDFMVLLTGETGSGKELVARAIHKLSCRRDAPFVPVDCGSMPANLVENELFGHDKGSFTGAYGPQPGKFEAASGGTLFLDEISNLPLSSAEIAACLAGKADLARRRHKEQAGLCARDRGQQRGNHLIGTGQEISP